ncbi:MAG: hypothetical protein MMC23_003401 [Stictis urceolatum]|nr:hypothetical protein [Stictis urceolata]
MGVLNVFRVAGDVSHTVSICILLWAIHVNRSAEGVSLITQSLYAAVFCTRYMDLLWVNPFSFFYNTFLKIFYISSSLYIIFIMMRVFPRTREREKAWKFGGACLGGSLLLAPFAMLIFMKKEEWSFWEFLRSFSLILESVCVLPQLLLLRQTSVPTVIDSFYLLTLGAYRALYIGNWIERGITEKGQPEAISVVFGVIQTLLYADFAWVYYTRQRVKLRNGAVVDADDLGRGFLVSKVLGRADRSFDEENRPEGGQGNWGARGISVSADEETTGSRPKPPAKDRPAGSDDRPEESRGMLSNPDAFEDNDSDVDDTLPQSRPNADTSRQ